MALSKHIFTVSCNCNKNTHISTVVNFVKVVFSLFVLVSSNPEPEAEPSAEAEASPDGEAEVSCHITQCHIT